MDIPAGTPSLLLTLLAEIEDNADEYFNSLDIDQSIRPTVQKNIKAVVEALYPPPFRRNLVKDAAQKELYYVLYEIIEKEYETPHEEPEPQSSDPQLQIQLQAHWQAKLEAQQQEQLYNRTLNSAIGRALESAIRGELKDLPQVKALREELRKKIIKALTPKQVQ
ncbi:MAG TPA: hypothetical protein VLK82_10090 [Candidatus Tectomicrobia bacterium]|nr:hypothetical protein [Candidatus Tectomicrobia bacterium]